MGEHLVKHGDGVKDIAFQVEDCDFLVKVKQMCFISACIWFMFHLNHKKKKNEISLIFELFLQDINENEWRADIIFCLNLTCLRYSPEKKSL